MRREWVVGVAALLTCVFIGPALMEHSDGPMDNTNPLEKWLTFTEQMDASGDSSHVADNPKELSYQDGPFPLTNEDGSYRGVPSDDQPCWPPSEHCYISDTMRTPSHQLVNFSINPVTAAGNFVVGDNHESYIGDKNGNGILEWVVIFLYIPWMYDGLDNDGDGCIDEKNTGIWSGQVGCDNMYDGAVVYETGGLPIAGGDKGNLLMNLDWYSVEPSLEMFRATVSPPFRAYAIRGFMHNLHIAGEFVSYQASESENYVNSNPEIDNDLDDFYVGNVDARLFPARAPVNNVCSAGLMSDEISPTWKREDGYIITTYELVEQFDGRDWNGDGDIQDNVIAYYTVDPQMGYCRIGVNTAVQGALPKTSGEIIVPGYTSERGDSHDWNGDGDEFDYVQLYHEINSTWHLRGRIYMSYTYYNLFITLYGFGFGWWALFRNGYNLYLPVLPFEFGGAYTNYVVSSAGYYHSYYFLISDEDGDRHTELPERYIIVGTSMGIVGNKCVLIQAREMHMYHAGYFLIGRGDANGDGDWYDTFSMIFCPDERDGYGSFIVDPTAKMAKGLYKDPIPAIWEGYVEMGVFPSVDGYATIPSYSSARCKLEDNFIPWYSGRKVDQIYWIHFG